MQTQEITNQNKSREKWIVRLIAFLTFLAGVINISSAIQPALRERVELLKTFMPEIMLHGSRVLVAVVGFALILVASGLLRRKRIAWMISLALLSISFAGHLNKGLDIEEAGFNLLLIVLLVITSNNYKAISDKGSFRHGIIILAASILFTLIYGTAGFLLLDRHFGPVTLQKAIAQTWNLFFDPQNSLLQPLTNYGRFFKSSIVIIGASSFLMALISMLRPVLEAGIALPAEREKAKQIIEEFGRSGLCRALLFPDKSYFFFKNCVIGYSLGGRTAVALGDPVGPEGELPACIAAFKQFCANNDWIPLFVSVLPDNLQAYSAAGLQSLCLGYEAIVNLKDFSLEGSQHKNMRNAHTHIMKTGYRAEVVPPPHAISDLQPLRQISDAWLKERGLNELRFSDGWFDPAYLAECPLIIVRDADAKPVAFSNLVGEYQKNEVTIDLMRHYPDVEPGTMEFLFVSALFWAKEKGYDSFSLGLSAIAGVGEEKGDPQTEKALHLLSTRLSRYFDFAGLRKFKDKFNPTWEPRYLIYDSPANLPAAVTGLIEVHSSKTILQTLLGKK